MSQELLVAPTTLAACGPGSSFVDFYRGVRPELAKRLLSNHLRTYDQAIVALQKFAGERVRSRAINDKLLDDFVSDAAYNGRSVEHRRELAGCIRQVALLWPGSTCTLPRNRKRPMPSPAVGTVRHYFETTYAPQAMVDATNKSIVHTRGTLRKLREYGGCDPDWTRLNDELAAAFLRSLRARGLSAATVNRARAELFAIWNHAFERGVVKQPPRVRKLKEVRDPPDAWAIDELRTILDAATSFRESDYYGEIPCALWWRAILLVAYYTGLRRGSLLGLRYADFNRSTGVLLARGDRMKNRRGKKFKLGPDAIEAIDRIAQPTRELLFATPHNATVISRHFGKLFALTSIPPSRKRRLSQFHKLRRSVYTAIAASAGIGAAAELCGHSSEYLSDRYLDPEKIGTIDVSLTLPSLARIRRKPR